MKKAKITFENNNNGFLLLEGIGNIPSISVDYAGNGKN